MCPECDRKQGKFSKNFSAMGNLFSSRDSSQQSGGTPNTAPKVIKKKTRKPPTILELEVAHYTPPSFPLMPIVTDEVMSVCRQSWARILAPVDVNGISMSGMTLFYTQFYETLTVLDTSRKFEAVLKRHTSGMNSIAAKGAIIIRVVNFSLALDSNDSRSHALLVAVGRSHNGYKIRPWMYSVFVQTLLHSISIRLDVLATPIVMSAWVNLFAFIMQSLLPPALHGNTDNLEIDCNFVVSELGSQTDRDHHKANKKA